MVKAYLHRLYRLLWKMIAELEIDEWYSLGRGWSGRWLWRGSRRNLDWRRGCLERRGGRILFV